MTVQREPTTALPTWRELPVSDGVPMDNNNHPIQAELYLGEPLRDWLTGNGVEAFVGHNSFVFYDDPLHYKGPDFYVVNGGQRNDQGSWVVWAEKGLYPSLIVELLSPKTEKSDRTEKRDFYRTTFKTKDYFIYDTEDQRFEGWQLHGGSYRPVRVLPSGRVLCQSLPLELGVHGKWLRWFTRDGSMLLTGAERADVAERRLRDAEARMAEMAAEIERLRRQQPLQPPD